MFHNILGDDGRGNPFLKQVTIAPNTWLDRTPICDQFMMGYGELVETDQPIIHLCPNVLPKGGIEKGYIPTNPSHHGYVQVSPVFCNSLGNRASWKMMTLAHFLIYMLMLIVRLNDPPLQQPVISIPPLDTAGSAQDLSRGRNNYVILDHEGIPMPDISPLRNAASFAWFSTQLFWTVHCDMYFGSPINDDNHPPFIYANSGLHRILEEGNFMPSPQTYPKAREMMMLDFILAPPTPD